MGMGQGVREVLVAHCSRPMVTRTLGVESKAPSFLWFTGSSLRAAGWYWP